MKALVRQNPGFVIVEEPVKSNPIEFVISWKRNHLPDQWQILGRFVIDFNSAAEKYKIRLIQHLLYSKGIDFNQAAIEVDNKPAMEERQFSDLKRFKRKLTYLMNRYNSDIQELYNSNMFEDIKEKLLREKFEELREALIKAYRIYGVTLKDVNHEIKHFISHEEVEL